MAAKPNIALARFASLMGANRIAPTGAQRDNGFQPGEPVPSGMHNELWYQSYLWSLYLSDGTLQGNHSITGTLDVGGAVTVANTVEANDYYHGDQVLEISGLSGRANANVTYNATTGSIASSGGGTTMLFAVPLRRGDRIKSVTYARLGTGAVDLFVNVYKLTAAASRTLIGQNLEVNIGNTWGDRTIDVTDTKLAARETIFIEAIANATGINVGNISVTYDRPRL